MNNFAGVSTVLAMVFLGVFVTWGINESFTIQQTILISLLLSTALICFALIGMGGKKGG